MFFAVYITRGLREKNSQLPTCCLSQILLTFCCCWKKWTHFLWLWNQEKSIKFLREINPMAKRTRSFQVAVIMLKTVRGEYRCIALPPKELLHCQTKSRKSRIITSKALITSPHASTTSPTPFSTLHEIFKWFVMVCLLKSKRVNR